MKVSVLTAVKNNVETIDQCINSVSDQSYDNIEHIIIDGGSTDGTLDIIKKHGNAVSRLVSEHDQGIYHALNKGIEMATGDIVGFLHADDFYVNHNVIESVVSHMTKFNVDSCYGDLEYVSRKDTEKVIRYWKSCPFEDGLLRKGWMPPHPTFFVKRHIYNKHGYFNTDFRIAADYELILRFLGKEKVSTYYIPEVLVRMRTGGASNKNLINLLRKTTEDFRAMKLNNLNGSLYAIISKNISKIPQFFNKY